MSKRDTEMKMGTTGEKKYHRGKEVRRRKCGKTKIDGEAWLPDDLLKVETS
jgi:hypothetical protein